MQWASLRLTSRLFNGDVHLDLLFKTSFWKYFHSKPHDAIYYTFFYKKLNNHPALKVS